VEPLRDRTETVIKGLIEKDFIMWRLGGTTCKELKTIMDHKRRAIFIRLRRQHITDNQRVARRLLLAHVKKRCFQLCCKD
jgi:hypothetical protein